MLSKFSAIIAQLPLALCFLVFPALAGLSLRYAAPAWRARWLAVWGIAMLPLIAIAGSLADVFQENIPHHLKVSLGLAAIYVMTVLVSWLLLRRWGREPSGKFWLAFGFPILVLIVVRFLPGDWHYFSSLPPKHIAEIFLGVSYMAFRLSHLALEYRNRVVELPTLSEYLAFGFFPPTLSVGPISPYSLFRGSLDRGGRPAPSSASAFASPAPSSASAFASPAPAPFQCFLRILVGLVKFLFLATLADQLSYSGLLTDGHPHAWIDLPIAAVFYYVYLYLNFSGWCDMAIGAAGMIGIEVAENFNHPFLSRNIQEYWSRWHMTLTGYMRDVVFTPLSKSLVRAWGPRQAHHAIALSIFCVFLAMGCWHGLSWNFLIYYFFQGVGVVVVHYYTIFLKKRLGREGYARYEANRYIRWTAVALNLSYACGTLFFFANPQRMRTVVMVFL